MAEGKMFKGGGKALKRVPKWAWYVSGGVVIAGGIMYFVQRQPVDEPGGDLVTDEGAVGYSDPQQSPGIIVPPVIGGEAVPAELNTDIPQGTFDLLGGFFSDAIAAIGGQQLGADDVLAIIAAAGSPQQGANAGGVVTAAPPSAAKPKPKPNPASKLEAGYHAGSTVDMGPKARKTFRGAVGWARIGDGGKGAAHYIDVHVRFCTRLERWRVRPNAKGSPWQKVWQGPRPNIC